MSDGREERTEQVKRLEQEKEKDREDRIVHDEPNGWEPEREDS